MYTRLRLQYTFYKVKAVIMPAHDDWKQSITNELKSIKESSLSIETLKSVLDDKLAENNAKLKSDLVTEVTRLVTENISKDLMESSQDLENRISDKLSSAVSSLNEKISEVEASSAQEKVAKSAIQAALAAQEAVMCYESGLFFPNILHQLKNINPILFEEKFRGKADTLPSFKATDYCLDFIYKILLEADLSAKVLSDNAFVQHAAVFGSGPTKNLSLRFSNKPLAESLRQALLSFNNQQHANNLPSIRFSRIKTKYMHLDDHLGVGNATLYAAKSSNLISAYYIAPRLNSDKCSVSLSTRVRFPGDTVWTPVAWTCQNLDQASADLTSLMTTAAPADLAAFRAKLDKIRERYNKSSTKAALPASQVQTSNTPPTSTSTSNNLNPLPQRNTRRTTAALRNDN